MARFEKLSVRFIIGLITVFLALAIFGMMAYGLLADDLLPFDTFLGKYIQSFRSDGLTPIMIFLTMFGQLKTFDVLAVIFALLMVYFKRPIIGLLQVFTYVGAWGLNHALKDFFARSRPSFERLIVVHGYSFPSGHAMISTAFYGMLGYFLYRYLLKSYKSGWPVIVLTILFILMISISRVYLGVHYMSDILAGLAAGSLWLFVCIYIFKSLEKIK